MDLPQIVDYLSSGGLISILTHGMEGVPHARAWLIFDTQGNVTHTFAATKGGLGGSNIPFPAVQNGKILEAQLGMVIAFLQSFGLNVEQAEQIIFSVGIEGNKRGPLSNDRSRKSGQAN